MTAAAGTVPAGPSPLDGGRLRARLAAGQATVGTFVGAASPVTAEACAAAGVDWLVLDLEHGAGGEEQVRDVVPAAGGLRGPHRGPGRVGRPHPHRAGPGPGRRRGDAAPHGHRRRGGRGGPAPALPTRRRPGRGHLQPGLPLRPRPGRPRPRRRRGAGRGPGRVGVRRRAGRPDRRHRRGRRAVRRPSGPQPQPRCAVPAPVLRPIWRRWSGSAAPPSGTARPAGCWSATAPPRPPGSPKAGRFVGIGSDTSLLAAAVARELARARPSTPDTPGGRT